MVSLRTATMMDELEEGLVDDDASKDAHGDVDEERRGFVVRDEAKLMEEDEKIGGRTVTAAERKRRRCVIWAGMCATLSATLASLAFAIVTGPGDS